MLHSTLSASNNPHSADYATGLIDSPTAEIQAAAAEQAQLHAEMLDRAADAKHFRAVDPSSTATIRCFCGLAGSGACELLYIRSPRTGQSVNVNQQFADELPPRLRGRICRAANGTIGTALFTLWELTRFNEVAKAHAPAPFIPTRARGRRW